jgi:FkbM family methyltransferase
MAAATVGAGAKGALTRRARNAIDAVGPLRALVKSRPGQLLVNTQRGARVLREPLRFAALQFGGRRVSRYRLRDTGIEIFLRHGTRDVDVLNEIFGGTGGRLIYDPPAPVRAMLDAKPSPTMLDLGANVGLFGAYALGRWRGASIASFEPDPANLHLLRHVVAANGFGRQWSVSGVAVSNQAAEMRFEAGLFADSHLAFEAGALTGRRTAVAGDDGAITVHAVDVFAQDHDVDLMKMDIEGGEWAILTDCRLADLKADVVVMEWHLGGCPAPENPPACAISLLRAAGYSGFAEVVDGGEAGTLWAWREPAQVTS